jgi:hypothetical protein
MMRTQNIFVALFLIGVGSSLAGPRQSQVQPSAASAKVILESVDTYRSMNRIVGTSLFIRVWSDRRVEYQKNDENNTFATATISDQQLTSLRKRLDAIDTRKIKEQMGAYNTFEDSSVEMQIRFAVRGADLSFSVTNPFPEGVPGPSLRKGKRLPKDIRDLICECYRVRTSVAHEPIYPFCESRQDPGKKQN